MQLAKLRACTEIAENMPRGGRRKTTGERISRLCGAAAFVRRQSPSGGRLALFVYALYGFCAAA